VPTRTRTGIARFAPGLPALLHYRPEYLPRDVAAGISVAAVAIPVAIAYAQLGGFPAVTGLYASILPLVVYAIFGTSPQLMVNPDAATCAMVAVIIAPLAGNDPEVYLSLSVALAVLTGIVSIVAGLSRLGFLADFLGTPVLVGFLNGISISIFLGQIGKVFGFAMTGHGIIPRLVEFLSKLPQTHLPTLLVGGFAFVLIRLVRRYFPKLPAPFIAVAAAIAIVKLFNLEQYGVAILGPVPAGLPHLRVPHIEGEHVAGLLNGALGLGLVTFSSGMVTARSFAVRNHYDLDVDREFIALGACNIAAGLSQGFAVSGADSRTAIADSMGGKTQVTGLVAALAMALVLLFFTGPLSYLPVAALGAVLISAAVGLFDFRSLEHLWRVSKREFAVSIVATLAVVAFGGLEGILIAVALATLFVVIRTARPHDALLARAPGEKGFHDLTHSAHPTEHPGLVLFRFPAAILFFNATYFKSRVEDVLAERRDTKWFVVDGSPINAIDATAAGMIEALAQELSSRGIRLGFANVRSEVTSVLEKSGAAKAIGTDMMFETLGVAVDEFLARGSAATSGVT